jgi:hypothetical protein
MAGLRLCEGTRRRLHLGLYKIWNMQNVSLDVALQSQYDVQSGTVTGAGW